MRKGKKYLAVCMAGILSINAFTMWTWANDESVYESMDDISLASTSMTDEIFVENAGNGEEEAALVMEEEAAAEWQGVKDESEADEEMDFGEETVNDEIEADEEMDFGEETVNDEIEADEEMDFDEEAAKDENEADEEMDFGEAAVYDEIKADEETKADGVTGTVEKDSVIGEADPEIMAAEEIGAMDLEQEDAVVELQDDTAASEGSVCLDADHFPDEVFRNYIRENYDKDEDGVLSESEISEITSLIMSAKLEIASLEGVKYLTKLRSLYYFSGLLSELDVSDCKVLMELGCPEGQLRKINVNGCTSLIKLDCQKNQLEELDVSSCTALRQLYCGDNPLGKIDVKDNTVLRSLGCANTNLETIDISNCPSLKTLICVGNQIQNIDLSNCPLMEQLTCDDNLLRSLDLSACPLLRDFSCANNQLSELNLETNAKIEYLSCSGNNLREITGINCKPLLRSISCRGNQLKELDLSGCKSLYTISCSNNQLRKLDISGCKSLLGLSCENNQLSVLDVSDNASLSGIYCQNNQLLELSVSKCTELLDLTCAGNQIAYVDIGSCPKLLITVKDGTRCDDEDSLSVCYKGRIKFSELSYRDSTIIFDKTVTIFDGNEVLVEGTVKIPVIFFDANGGACEESARKMNCGDAVAVLPVPTRSGFDFTGWYTAKTGGERVTEDKEISDNVTFYAQWAEKNLAVPVLSSVVKTSSGVTVTWKPVAGASKYRVFRKDSSGGWSKVGDTEKTSFTDTKVSEGTYTVRCLSITGTGYISSFSVNGMNTAPVLTGISNTTSGVKITWGKVTGAANYRVFRKTGSGSWKDIGTTAKNSYTDKTAKSGKKYSYTVRCMNSGKTVYTSSYDAAGKSITYLSTPALSSAKATKGVITVKWSKVTGASGYYVYRKTSSKGSWKRIAKITSGKTVSYKDKTVKKGKTYIYTVRAYRGSTKSGYQSSGIKAKAK